MNKNIIILGIVVAIIAIGGVVAITSNQQTRNQNSNSSSSVASIALSGYFPYTAQAVETASSNSVLFFHANWCPNCRALDENINENASKIPDNLRILKVDFDNSQDLRQKYGVNTQHTLVLVSNSGREIKKASGIFTLQELVNFSQTNSTSSISSEIESSDMMSSETPNNSVSSSSSSLASSVSSSAVSSPVVASS